MIKETKVKIKWNPKNKRNYVEKGYAFTKFGDTFEVNLDDLSKGSHAVVAVCCDGKGCAEELSMEYRTYLRLSTKNDGKIYCRKCAAQLQSERLFKDKGVYNQFQLQEVKDKSKKTRLKKFGVEYITQSESYKEKYLYGDKNNFWIDGRNCNAVDRNNAAHKRWHNSLLEIYGYQCFICGSNEKLECHHIYSFSNSKELAYDLENGVVLCQFHHKDFHKHFGSHCTYDDFINYLTKTCRDYRKDIPFRDKG